LSFVLVFHFAYGPVDLLNYFSYSLSFVLVFHLVCAHDQLHSLMVCCLSWCFVSFTVLMNVCLFLWSAITPGVSSSLWS
jgi:hypothetical protein